MNIIAASHKPFICFNYIAYSILANFCLNFLSIITNSNSSGNYACQNWEPTVTNHYIIYFSAVYTYCRIAVTVIHYLSSFVYFHTIGSSELA